MKECQDNIISVSSNPCIVYPGPSIPQVGLIAGVCYPLSEILAKLWQWIQYLAGGGTTSTTTTTTTLVPPTTSTTTTTSTTAPPSSTTTTTTTPGTTTSSTTTTTTTIVTTSTTTTTTTAGTTTSSTTTTTTTSGGGQFFTFSAPSNGYLELDGAPFGCGDTIILQGNFKSVIFTELNGCPGNPIVITNPTGQITTIGDPNWSGGSYATALEFVDCHYIDVHGSSQANFVINGSTQAARGAYYDFSIVKLSDNFEVYNVTINNGGAGLYCKTEPVPAEPDTYDPVGGPYTYLENFKLHDIRINGTLNEGTYIGHTGNYWCLTCNPPYGSQFNGNSSQFVPGQSYAEPLRLKNVEIYNLVVSNTGADGMQTAAIENLVIHHNEVYNYALSQVPAHSAGLLLGGKTKNYNVYCNYIHDGWGELGQFFGDGTGGGTFTVTNNLFVNNAILGNAYDGISFRLVNNAVINFNDNTVAQIGGVALRTYTGTSANNFFSRNVIAQPVMNSSFSGPRTFIYDEPGTGWTEGTGSNSNVKAVNMSTAQIETIPYYQPLSPASPSYGRGYNRPFCATGTTTSSTTTTTTTIITTSTTTTTTTAGTTSSTTTTTTTAGSTTTTTTTTGPTTTTTSSTTTTSTTNGDAAQFFAANGYKSDAMSQYGWVYLPPNYDPGRAEKYPWGIFLHGQGQTGTGAPGGGTVGVDKLLTDGPPKYFNEGDEPEDFIMFSPQLAPSPGTWEPIWVDAARAWMVANYNVDPERFYLTGLSLGGSGTSKYIGSDNNTYQGTDKVAAYLIATGDTQWQRFSGAGYLGPGGSRSGIRQADIPGWFLAGTADGTISVNNGVGALNVLNALSPKPKYPYRVDTFWNLTHSGNLWNTQVYNRSGNTNGTGTASFDYIEWFKRFKRNDDVYSATSYVAIAEASNNWTDYRVALRLVNALPSSTQKTALLSRLSAVKAAIEAVFRVIEISFGAAAVAGNVNIVNTANINQPTSNLIDVNGVATAIDFTLITQVWTPPSVSNNINLNHEYHGMPSSFYTNAYRVFNNNTWRFSDLNNAKAYKARFYYGNISENNTIHWAINITINGVTKTLDNEMVNTHKYVDFDGIVPSAGIINMAVNSFSSNGEDNMFGMVLFETVTGGTTTTSTSSTTTTTTTAATTTTTSSTTTTSTTVATTTTSSTTTTTTTAATTTTTSSTTTSTTTLATTTTTSSTTTTTTTVATTTTTSSTTTTTTTGSANPIARFNFNALAQSVANWKDVSGQPDQGVLTATDNLAGTNYRVTSILGKWGAFGSTANNANGGTGVNADFPANVMLSYWFNYSLTYPSSGANLKIDQLLPNTNYQLKMIGSRSSVNGGGIPAGQNRIMEYIVSRVATPGDASEQSNIAYAARDSVTTQTFTIQSNASGEIYLGVYCSRTGDTGNGNQFGYLNGLTIQQV